MNDNSLILVLILIAIPILIVLLYNTYQEKKYRDSIRAQFGHADKDALLESMMQSVRDHKAHRADNDDSSSLLKPAFNKTNTAADNTPKATVPTPKDEPNGRRIADSDDVVFHMEDDEIIQLDSSTAANETDAPASHEPPASLLQAERENQETSAFSFKNIIKPQSGNAPIQGDYLLDVHDLPKQDLSWFDSRFDYMAYIALQNPQELHSMPRLSGSRRFRIVGCTMDDRFQIAEPIPSVYYQGFVIGLQAISRNGLASTEELAQFGEQANAFASKMGGRLLLTDIDTFLQIARPLDELCARVDQTIAIHLVSRNNISGVELRTALERKGFDLAHDGMFYYNNKKGEPLFAVSTLDGSAFTSALLSSQNYRGFSMLFDAPHISDGEKNFNLFMDIAVKLTDMLGLDLVNDKLEELTTQWLKEVRSYVVARQDEMRQVGIEPGGELAQRLFS